jgi:YkoY family integral membrane protein
MEFNLQTLATILSLAVLESLLSIDNAVVLAVIARGLRPSEQKRALSYGLIGAIVLRLGAILIASHLIRFPWLKVLGGVYLFWLSVQYFFFKKSKSHETGKSYSNFWRAVLAIEFTDLVFAVDSILAAVAITNNICVIMIGGMIGVIAVRFAASHMIKILNRFPFLEKFAYGLIAGVSIKVITEGVYSFW